MSDGRPSKNQNQNHSFAHLHVHTDYSLLDGMTRVKDLVYTTSRLGQPAVAINDHGSVSAAYALWYECQQLNKLIEAGTPPGVLATAEPTIDSDDPWVVGHSHQPPGVTATTVKPIIGEEFYVAPDTLSRKEPVYWGTSDQRDSDVGSGGKCTHLTVLAESAEGLHNLFRLYTLSYADGFYGKPRIDVDALEAHKSGLIILSGCLGGELLTKLRLGLVHEVDAYLDRMKGTFGDSFYIELMHHGLEDVNEEGLNKQLVMAGVRHSIPTVATNDSHYTLAEDSPKHEAFLCLQTKATLSDARRFKFGGSGYHLRSRYEMDQLPLPDESVRRTLEIAERVGSYDEVFKYELRMPKFDVEDSHFHLTCIAAEGLGEKLGDNDYDENKPHWNQLHHELRIIKQREVDDYFLVLKDIIDEYRNRGGRIGPGRGSVGGSLVGYALGLHSLDPIEEGLLFERFLDPSRVGLPDIDIDFEDKDLAIKIAQEKYGFKNVAQVGTWSTEGSKSSIHDAGRTLGFRRAFTDELVSFLPPPKFGRAPSLSDYTGPRVGDAGRVIEYAERWEGLVRGRGLHAAGVVVSPHPLGDTLPVYLDKDESGKAANGNQITAFDNTNEFPILQKLGYVNYDFLGLNALTTITTCLTMLSLRDSVFRERSETRVSTLWETLLPTRSRDCTDPKTYELLQSGHTLGVFQLDSDGMRQLLRQLKPTRFTDISAVLALYRPGPMGVDAHRSFAKRAAGREPVSYPHPELESAAGPILEETYGLIVFQEQVLDVLREVCGYTIETASEIFYAMRKKLTEKMLAAEPDFHERMLARGYSQECSDALWNTLVPFSDYSFNRSHTTGYGLVAYWTAYLKANHPVDWMAALLTTESKPEKQKEYIREVGRMGIKILPPDINESMFGWTPVQDNIRYGVGTIKGVAEKAFMAVAAKRPYRSVHDYFNRGLATALNKKVLEALVQAGAFDTLTPYREELLVSAATTAERALTDRKGRRKGQQPLIKPNYEPTSRGWYDGKARQTWEREVLGVALTVPTVTAVATRWLSEEDFEYLREVALNNPGSSPLTVKFGPMEATANRVAFVTPTKELVAAFSTIGLEIE